MRRPHSRLLLVLLLLAGLWSITALLLAPYVIRQAYAGRSFSAINALLGGRAQHPVRIYLALWRRVAISVTLVAVLALALALVAWRFRAPLRAAANRVLREPALIGMAQCVWLGAWFGFLGGLAEAASPLIRLAVTGDPREAPSPANLWLAPIASALFGALAGWLLALLLRARRGLSLRLPAAIFSAAAAYAFIVPLRIGLQHYAVLILALGLGTQIGLTAHRHAQGFQRLVRRSSVGDGRLPGPGQRRPVGYAAPEGTPGPYPSRPGIPGIA